MDASGLYGSMSFSNVSSNITSANFLPMLSTLPVDLTPHLTHRDLHGSLRDPSKKNTAGAYEVNTIVTSINPVDEKNYSIVYPNPTTGLLYFQLENNVRVLSAEIYDYTGQLVKTLRSHDNSIDIQNIANGIYFVRITEIGKYYKIVKQ